MSDNQTVEGHGHHRHAHHPAHSTDGADHEGHGTSSGTDKVKDPVCGMMVDPHTTSHRAQFGGKPYYFCSSGCQQK
jgi:Cu+-exporting ATPase